MRYVKVDKNRVEIISNLKDIIKNHSNSRTRNRALAIKMNIEQKEGIPKLAKIFEVKQRAIYDWFDRFDKYGIIGIMERNGRGRKKIIRDKKN